MTSLSKDILTDGMGKALSTKSMEQDVFASVSFSGGESGNMGSEFKEGFSSVEDCFPDSDGRSKLIPRIPFERPPILEPRYARDAAARVQ